MAFKRFSTNGMSNFKPLKFFILFLIFISCEKEFVQSPKMAVADNSSVSISDVMNHLAATGREPSVKSGKMDIEVITDEGDTVMYLVNYSKGWELLSADKNAPVSLMWSDSGDMTVDELCMNPTQEKFITKLKSGIRTLSDDINQGRIIVPDSVDNWYRSYPPNNPGYDWHLWYSEVIYDRTKTQDHLMSTKWGQGADWNQYAPYQSQNSDLRCPAGCMMVAAGQVLYYLHTEKNFPMEATTSVNQPVHYAPPNSYVTVTSASFTTSYNESVWSAMPRDSSEVTNSNRHYVPLLLHRLGYLYGAQYSAYATGASILNTIPVLGYYYRTNCQIRDYFESFATAFNADGIVCNQILNNQMPVIVSVFEAGWSNGHAIVVDGFKYRCVITRTYYIKRITGETKFEDTTVKTCAAAINWGWDGFGDSMSDGEPIWYNTSSSFIVENTYNFLYAGSVVYNFTSN